MSLLLTAWNGGSLFPWLTGNYRHLIFLLSSPLLVALLATGRPQSSTLAPLLCLSSPSRWSHIQPHSFPSHLPQPTWHKLLQTPDPTQLPSQDLYLDVQQRTQPKILKPEPHVLPHCLSEGNRSVELRIFSLCKKSQEALAKQQAPERTSVWYHTKN